MVEILGTAARVAEQHGWARFTSARRSDIRRIRTGRQPFVAIEFGCCEKRVNCLRGKILIMV